MRDLLKRFWIICAAVVLVASIAGYMRGTSARHGRMEIDESTDGTRSFHETDSSKEEKEIFETPHPAKPALIRDIPAEEDLTRVLPVYASCTSELAPESSTILSCAECD